MTPIVYYKNAEAPALNLWWFSDDGTLVDFSSGVSGWQLKIGQYGETALLTKTTGIAGAAGAGTDPSGTPNVVVTWSADELDLTPGHYSLQLTATTTAGDRVLTAPFWINNTIT